MLVNKFCKDNTDLQCDKVVTDHGDFTDSIGNINTFWGRCLRQ